MVIRSRHGPPLSQSILEAKQNPEDTVASAVWVDEIGAWNVKARATYESGRADAVAAAVGILFQRARLTISGGTT